MTLNRGNTILNRTEAPIQARDVYSARPDRDADWLPTVRPHASPSITDNNSGHDKVGVAVTVMRRSGHRLHSLAIKRRCLRSFHSPNLLNINATERTPP